jgi:tetratricopeptide (TPR) repeat protein
LAGHIKQSKIAAQLRRAEEAQTARDFAGARLELEQCLATSPDSAEAHWLLARTLRRAALYSQAEAAWDDKCFNHLAESRRLHYDSDAVELETDLLGTMRGELPRQQKQLLSRVGKGDADAPLILEALVPAYLASQQLPLAMNCVTQLLALEADNPQVWFWRGLVREQLMFLRLAVADYEKALELSPNFDEARLRLAQSFVGMNSFAEAETHLELLRERRPNDPAVLLALARCFHARGKLPETEQLLERLPPGDANTGAALLERGKLALETGRTAESEALLRQALAASPNEAQVCYTLSQCLRQRGQKAESDALLARFQRFNADWTRFRSLTEKMRSESRDPAILCEAGVILLRNGQAPAGLGWLASALQAAPDYAPAHLALAAYYQQSGDTGRADHHRRLAEPGLKRIHWPLSLP